MPAFQGDPTKPGYYVGPDSWFQAAGRALGFVPEQLDPNAPGGSLDTSDADAQRAKTDALIQQLQQQAATGNGAWQPSFAEAVQAAKGNTSALGQSEAAQAKTGASGALRNIGNAQSGIAQRALGQEQVLKAQSERDAQNQLSQLEGAEGQGDIAQANAAAAVRQQSRETNQALIDQAHQTANGALSGGGGAAMAFLSNGGKVPGKAEVYGDDERNDTQPALLSPGEIVIPRTIANSPGAARKAADFVRAVKARGAKKLADGGGLDTAQGPNFGQVAEMILAPHLGVGDYFSSMGGGPQDASIANGGLLDTSAYDAARANMDTLSGQLGNRAGGGTSIADSIAKQQSDETTAQAIAAQNTKHAVMAAVLQSAAKKGSDIAGGAGERRQKEQSEGQAALGNLLQQRRAQELELASNKQQQAWNNTMTNAKISLANQAALRGMVAGAGAGITALAHSRSPDQEGGGDEFGDPRSGQTNDLGDQGTVDLSGGGDERGDASSGQTNDLGDQGNFAEGGEVPRVVVDSGIANKTLAQLKREYDAQKAQEAMAKGPDLSYNLLRFAQALKDKAAKEELPAAMAATPYKSALAAAAPKVVQPVMAPMPPPMAPPKQLKVVPVQSEHVVAAADPSLDEFQLQRAHGGRIQRLAYGGGADGGADAGTSDAGTPPIPSGLDLSAFNPAAAQAAQVPGTADAGIDPNSLYAPGTAGPETSFPGAALDKNGVYTINPKDRIEGMARYVPSPQPAPKPAAVKVPAPTGVAKTKSGGASNPLGSIVQPDGKAERSALEQATKTEQQKADEIYKAQAAALTAQQQLQNDQRDLQRQAQNDAHAQLARFDAANDAMQRIDTTVDTNHYWSSMSTPQKIMGAIGLVLGSFGKDGVNQSAILIGKAIDRDIDGQKAQAQLALKKGESNVANAQNMVQMHRDIFKDDQAALTAAQVSALGLAAQQVKLTEAKFAGTEAGDRLKMLSAQLDQTIADKKRAIVKDSLEDNLKRAQTAQAWAAAQKEEAEAQAKLNPAAKGPKNAEQVAGTLAAVDDLEKEMKDATSTQIGSKRASLEAELLKLQGGRYNKEIHQLMEEIVPGNEGYSVAGRASSKIFPESMKQRFETLRKHIRTEGNTPQEEDEESLYK